MFGRLLYVVLSVLILVGLGLAISHRYRQMSTEQRDNNDKTFASFASASVIRQIKNLNGQLQIIDHLGLPRSSAKPCLHLTLNDPRVTDDHLHLLKQVNELRSLSLGGTQITGDKSPSLGDLKQLKFLTASDISDSGVERLQMLKELEHLVLSDIPISDKGLAAISKILSLRKLTLRRMKVGDAGITRLENLPHLEYLELDDVGISDAGLSVVADFNALKRLVIKANNITDNGVKELSRSKSLESLALHGSAITDNALQFLAQAPHLQELAIGDANFTDSGLNYLVNASKLTRVILANTKVSESAAVKVRHARPDLVIVLNPTM